MNHHPTDAQMNARIMWLTLAVVTVIPSIAAVIHFISKH